MTGEDEPEEKPKAALGGLFGRAKKAAADTTGEAQPERKPAKALGGLFGRANSAAEKAINEIESEPKPKPFAGLLGGTKKVGHCNVPNGHEPTINPSLWSSHSDASPGSC